MKNEEFLDNLNNKENKAKRNKSDDGALLEVEEKINKLKHTPEVASENFQNELKMKILEKRRQKNSMKNTTPNFFGNLLEGLLRPKRLVPAVAALLIVAIVFGTLHFWPAGPLGPGETPFSGFSKLLISPAYAQDNFELIPSVADSLGVETNSVYILKSKEPLNTALIKDHLEIIPEFDYKLKEISDTEWQIVPEGLVEPNTIVRVALATSYIDEVGKQQERDYSWAFQIKDNFKVLHSIPRDTGTQVPTNTGIEITFSHDNFKDFEKYFSITPQVQGRFERHGRTMVFVPLNQLQVGRLYTVTVKKGLPIDSSNEVLAEDYSFTFETQPKSSYSNNEWFRIYRRIHEASSSQAPLIQVSASNLQSNEVDVGVYQFTSWQAYMNSIDKRDELPWWSYSKDDFRENTQGLRQVSTFKQTIKKEGSVQYIELPEALNKGFYLIEFNVRGIKDQVWLQVSDLAAYLNITKTDTLVWVNDLRSKSVVSGAEVELVNMNYRRQTNGKGIATFNTPAELIESGDNEKGNKRYYFKISKGGDVLIMAASKISRSYGWNSILQADDYWQYLYTDRPRYQTTDTIQYWGMIKGRDNNKIKEKVTATLFKEGYVDYYYRPVHIMEQEVELSSAGIFSGEMKFSDLRPDYYTLEIKVGDKVLKRKYLNIRPYIKPAYELTLIPDRKRAFVGENINLKVQAAFFEGTPVPDLDLVLKMPEGEYKFKTDEKGQAELTYTKKYEECYQGYSCWPKHAYLSIYPQNSELAEISADANVRFYGPNVYLEGEVSYPQEGVAEISMIGRFIDLEAVTENFWWGSKLGEKIAPGVKVEGEVTKITYTKNETGTYYDFINKKTYKQYSYGQKEEQVDSFSGVTDNNGKYVYRRNVEPETSYRVNLEYYDSSGKYNVHTYHLFYHNGRSIHRYTGGNYSYYHFSFSKEDDAYVVGEGVQAKFMINDDPMPEGNNRYLFLQLQNGLQEYAIANNYEYYFPFETRDIPNVNLVGVYFNGSSYTTTQTSYYGRSVTFDNSERALKIEIKTDKEMYEPGEEVTLSLEVKDTKNRSREADVNINLIDEAFYAVVDDSATPLAAIYNSLRPGSLLENKSHYPISQQFGGTEKGGCFGAGTMILMADGAQKPIEDVVAGERVMTFDDPRDLDKVSGVVSEVYQHIVSEYLIINDELEVTPQHLVYSNHRFQEAGGLKVGDWLLDSTGKKVIVENIEVRREIVPVYNLRIDPQHTYFAGGFYVHNEKGGGPREFFTDAALFKSVKTNSSGRASVTFTLPDNITSWRATAQAISKDIFVGVSTTKVPVSLPVFAEVTIGDEYLKDDKPIARMRAFGVALSGDDSASFTVKAPSMGADSSGPFKAKAFQPAYFNLPDLTEGKHDIIYELTTDEGDDAIKLPLDVIESRLEAQFARSEKLTAQTQVTADNDKPMVIVLSDEGQSQLYKPLQRLSWSWGDRVDQQISRKKGREILNDIYEEDIREYSFEAHNYQMSNGGITLLPYSDDELELSARMASVGADGFDKESLAQYLFRKLEDKNSNREEISLALYGLAELERPVLTRIRVWLERDDLSPKEKMYLAQALFDLGAEEMARGLYYGILEEHAEKKEPYVILRVNNDQDEVFHMTALAAVLASSLDAPERDGLWKYLTENQRLWGDKKNSERLFNLEKLNYIEHTLPNLKPSPAKIVYELFGKKKEAKITGGKIHTFRLEPTDVSELKFLFVEGDVGISVRQTKPINLSQVEPDSAIGIRREYYVNGKQTNTFSESDIIEVHLYPTFGSKAINGEYQITDILPSGLMPITKLYQRGGRYDCHYWYPYNSDGRMVKYKINRYWRSNYCGGDFIKYYARVKNRGEYKAEPAIIQSFLNPDYINYSNSGTINISE